MLLSLIGLYVFMTVVSAVLLGFVAGSKATSVDILTGAALWPYTTYKFIEHTIKS